jgi:hypothetical protein
VVDHKTSVGLATLRAAAQSLDREITVLLAPQMDTSSECSTVAASLNVIRDGAGSWKVHYMNLVDEFRRTLDPRLLLLPPVRDLALELRALLASIVVSLCDEAGMNVPGWARKRHQLPAPWFVAEVESLKAMALVESPLPFRRNNIFVLDNFLQRA